MNDLSLYIHIPFCKTICVYCGFLTYANREKRIDDYVNALLKEISLKAGKFGKRRIESVYFGGGTPSLLDAKKIGTILEKIRSGFRLAKEAEISIECNPESVTEDKLRLYGRYGINRISLGIQSLNPKTLWRVARPHTPADVENALNTIKKTGFRNFGADYIMGLPYQSLETFKSETKRILSFAPPHLSFYFLSRDTKKIDLIENDCPPEDEQVKMYEWLTQYLKKKGYVHYEVSNYALPGFECKHNLRYWHQREYLGLGLGAHSFLDNVCTINEENLEKYISSPGRAGERFELDTDLRRMDYIMLHLRTSDGLDLEEYERMFGDATQILKEAEYWIKSRMMKRTGLRLHATDKGFLFIDRITKDLL